MRQQSALPPSAYWEANKAILHLRLQKSANEIMRVIYFLKILGREPSNPAKKKKNRESLSPIAALAEFSKIMRRDSICMRNEGIVKLTQS